jgi:heme-degrading monooxygenase HmoA
VFIAMNRFKVAEGKGAQFEERWRARETYLDTVPGFLHFALLRGDTPGEYVSHSMWESRSAFDAWTRSEAFTAGHRQGSVQGELVEHPVVSLYEVVLEQGAALAPAATDR